VEVDSVKFKCAIIPKVEVIEDFDVSLNMAEHRQSKVRNFNLQNLRLMLVVFVYISSHFDAIHSSNVRNNLTRKKSLINPLFLVRRFVQGHLSWCRSKGLMGLPVTDYDILAVSLAKKFYFQYSYITFLEMTKRFYHGWYTKTEVKT